MNEEFVLFVPNVCNISSPWWCLLTGKLLAGRVIQHLYIFAGCLIADQTMELPWKHVGKAGEQP